MKLVLLGALALTMIFSFQSMAAKSGRSSLKYSRKGRQSSEVKGFVETSFGSTRSKEKGQDQSTGSDTFTMRPGMRGTAVKGKIGFEASLPVSWTDSGKRERSVGRPEFAADISVSKNRKNSLHVGSAVQLPIYNNTTDGNSGALLDSMKVFGLRPYVKFLGRRKGYNIVGSTSLQWNQKYTGGKWTEQGITSNFDVERAFISRTHAGIEYNYDRRITFGAIGKLAAGLGKNKLNFKDQRFTDQRKTALQRFSVEAYLNAQVANDTNVYAGFDLSLTENEYRAIALLTEYEDLTQASNAIRIGVSQGF